MKTPRQMVAEGEAALQALWRKHPDDRVRIGKVFMALHALDDEQARLRQALRLFTAEDVVDQLAAKRAKREAKSG